MARHFRAPYELKKRELRAEGTRLWARSAERRMSTLTEWTNDMRQAEKSLERTTAELRLLNAKASKRLAFGKYKGLSYLHVYRVEDHYVQWIRNKIGASAEGPMLDFMQWFVRMDRITEEHEEAASLVSELKGDLRIVEMREEERLRRSTAAAQIHLLPPEVVSAICKSFGLQQFLRLMLVSKELKSLLDTYKLDHIADYCFREPKKPDERLMTVAYNLAKIPKFVGFGDAEDFLRIASLVGTDVLAHVVALGRDLNLKIDNLQRVRISWRKLVKPTLVHVPDEVIMDAKRSLEAARQLVGEAAATFVAYNDEKKTLVVVPKAEVMNDAFLVQWAAVSAYIMNS